MKDAQEQLRAKIEVTHSSNGLFGSRAALGEDYLTRDVAAAMGLYGNDLAEAWYGGFVGDGRKPGQVRFASGHLPPAKFFWSVTLYTLPDRFLYANPLDRYSIGDRTRGLAHDADGGLTLYIGHTSPGADKESNWLPAPAGPYSLVARIYGPSDAAMKGEWKLPALMTTRADDTLVTGDITTPFGKITLDKGLPASAADSKTLYDELDFQRACQTYLWALAFVSFAEWQHQHEHVFGARDGQLVIYNTYKDKLGR